VLAERPSRKARRSVTRIPDAPTSSLLILTPEQLEAAARYACRCEGLNPDSITCSGRPTWQVHAQLLTEQFLPALNHALADNPQPSAQGS
jgi:hypothetical protein